MDQQRSFIGWPTPDSPQLSFCFGLVLATPVSLIRILARNRLPQVEGLRVEKTLLDHGRMSHAHRGCWGFTEARPRTPVNIQMDMVIERSSEQKANDSDF